MAGRRNEVIVRDVSREVPRSWKSLRQTGGRRKKPLVIAHRGAPGELPENTLASFARALDQGANVLETDLRFTQDGAIVLFHDATLDRTTDGSGLVAARTIEEIKCLRTISPYGEFTDERVPTLIELLSMTQAQVPLLLELKDPLFAQREYAQRLVRTLAAYGMLDKSAVVSFHSELVETTAQVCPQLPTGIITIRRPFPVRNTVLLGPWWPLLFLNPLYVANAHRMGSLVAPLDTAPQKRMWYYRRLGVDAVLADSPARAIEAMGGRQ
jgi:glycerophosphoryl diester phosphodiesterase